jgi:YfiH family protein
MPVTGALDWIEPDWPAPSRIRALTTTRGGGVSSGPYTSLNLADHVGDATSAVTENRRLLGAALDLPAAPVWLRQVHGCNVVDADQVSGTLGCTADAALASASGRVCAVLTADCLPVLLCTRRGTRVGAVHAGWRGLLDGVIESAIDAMAVPAEEILAWLGPAIGADAFEVGPEVRDAFVDRDPGAASAFRPGKGDRWMADVYALAGRRLDARRVGFVGGGGYCTVRDAERFFSYRRDGVTGRMASLIWIESPLA